jgi:hypothetical protein
VDDLPGRVPARHLEHDVELAPEVDPQLRGLAPARATGTDGGETSPVAGERATEVADGEPPQRPREPRGARVRELHLRGARGAQAEQQHTERAAEKDPA